MIVWFLLISCSPVEAFQQIEDSPAVLEAVQLIRGLKDRRLFDLAQRYAAEQLASEEIDRTGRSSIVLELIRTKTVEAISATGDDRQMAWNEALQLATDFRNGDPDHPRNILIDVQAALTYLAQGSLIRQEIAAEIVPAAAKEAAFEQFRHASEAFRQAENEIDRLLPLLRNRNPTADGLTPDQLVNLKNSVRYQLAVVNLAKAEMYDPADRLNQIDAINQVLSRLDEVLQQSNSDQPLWWEAQVARARCFRLMGHHERAAELFGNLPDAELTSDLQSAILTERILGLVAGGSGNGKDLLQVVQKFGNPSAELQLAHLQLLMAMAAGEQEATKTEWHQQATQLVRDIEHQQGRYWGRRAEILLVGAIHPDSIEVPNASGNFNTSSIDILIRQGDAAFRKGQFDDAVRAFTKAAFFATLYKDADQSLTATVRLAQSLEQQQQHQLAAEKLFEAALLFRESDNSPAMHLRGCWNWAQTEGNEEERNKRFVEYLKTQISNWPEAASTDQARLWLGNSYLSQSDWELALNSWLEIPIDSPLMPEAVGYIGICARRWIATEADAKGGSEIAGKISLAIAGKLSIRGSMPKTNWTESERLLLLLLIEIGLPKEAVQVGDALNWIDSALTSNPEEDHRWRQQALAWRVVLLAKQGQVSSELTDELKRLPNDPAVMQICLDGLKANLTTEQLDNMAEVIVLICDKAMAELNATDRPDTWQIEKAIAEIGTGNIQSGVNTLAELAARNPDSLKIQLQYARGLSRQENDLPAAIRQWRRLSTQVKSGSDPWWECKYNIALLLKQNQQTDEALRLLKYLKLTSDRSKQNSWTAKLDDLLADLERRQQ